MANVFLGKRTPPAPAPLATWLENVGVGETGDVPTLLRAGLSELDAARAEPGRVRRSAFHLLAADALITYACEAALGAGDSRGALVEILLQTASPRR